MPTVLITGASRGVGLEFARSFAADGWRVHASCRHPGRAKTLAAIEGEVLRHRADVTDGLQVAALSRELADEPIDLLINNAGILGPRPDFGKTPFDAWPEVFEVNTIAPLRMAQRFVEHLARSEQRLIVNVSSRMGSVAQNSEGGHYIYRSSKAALNMVVKSLSVDLATRGITVVAVHPGWVKTDIGGPDAAITPAESVAGLRAVMARLTSADNGRFFSYDGSEIPW